MSVEAKALVAEPMPKSESSVTGRLLAAPSRWPHPEVMVVVLAVRAKVAASRPKQVAREEVNWRRLENRD